VNLAHLLQILAGTCQVNGPEDIQFGYLAVTEKDAIIGANRPKRPSALGQWAKIKTPGMRDARRAEESGSCAT